MYYSNNLYLNKIILNKANCGHMTNRRAAAGSPPDQWWKRKSDPLLKKSTNTHDFSKISEVLWMGGDGKVDKTHKFGVEDQGSVPTVTHSPMCP